MFKKKLTFLLIPDSSGTSRQLSVRLWYLVAGSATVVALLFASFFLASEFLDERVSDAELERLRAENDRLGSKYEELRWSLAEVDSRYDQLVQKEISLRHVFGLPEISIEERQLGIGGPNRPLSPATSPAGRLAYSTEARVDRLLLLSRFELEKYAEVETGLEKLKDRLDKTPSIWPTRGWSSRGFGVKDDPFTGYPQFHRGIDISNGKGTPVIATADGRIREIGTYGRMGKMVVIDHGYGFVSRYGHLSKFEVKRGQKVKRGDVIARMGSTGYSTGPHLHYEVWRNGEAKNPRDFILNSK